MTAPSRRGPAGEVFPWMRQCVIAGLCSGAVLASLFGGPAGRDLSGEVTRWVLGAAAGGLFGVLLAMLWSVEAPGPPVSAPPTARREDLWDPWLDAGSTGGGGAAHEGAEDVDAAGDAVVPGRAPVRPRVLTAEGGGSMPLEDEVLPFAERGECGAIRISGPPGSGKTTALRHLAAVLPSGLGLGVLDEPDRTLLADRSARGLVVYASDDSSHPKHLATFRLAPWGDDERIEYLLGTARERCASVMTRLKEATDGNFLDGIPELWRVVLDRMAADATLPGARSALRREWGPRLADRELRALVQDSCLALLATPSVATGFGDRCRDTALLRLIRHRPVQIQIAADRIATDLASGAVCDDLGRKLPRDLIHEAAMLIREDPKAIGRLAALLDGDDRQKHPMAASLLHELQPGWRPATARVPSLSGAYLARVAWSGIDLEGAEIEGTDLSRADLSGARLDGTRADRAHLRQAVLRGASLKGVRAHGADLMLADLSSVRARSLQLQAANLEKARLEAAGLRYARFEGANLTDALLMRADLIGAHLEGANIDGADFTGARLESAVLSGLDLRRADFSRAGFEEAHLGECNLEGLVLPRANFRDAHLRGALLTGSSMPGANFRGACLQAAGLAEIEWEGACLADADLSRASFHLGSSRSGLVQSPLACEGSRTGFYTDDFDEQDFKAPEEIRKANLCGADLRGATIDEVDFYLVDLRGALFDPDQAAHLRRCGAILRDRG